MSDYGRVTRLLRALDPDDPQSTNRLFEAVYEDLKGFARGFLRRERPGHTMASTDLVSEGYLKIQNDLKSVDWEWNSRRQFYKMAARAMRQILVDYAKRRTRQKRGGGAAHVSLDDGPPDALLAEATRLYPEAGEATEQLRLDEALKAFKAVSPEAHEMVEVSYYFGLTHETIAKCFGKSTKTVQRRLDMAEAWLGDYLAASADA